MPSLPTRIARWSPTWARPSARPAHTQEPEKKCSRSQSQHLFGGVGLAGQQSALAERLEDPFEGASVEGSHAACSTSRLLDRLFRGCRAPARRATARCSAGGWIRTKQEMLSWMG